MMHCDDDNNDEDRYQSHLVCHREQVPGTQVSCNFNAAHHNQADSQGVLKLTLRQSLERGETAKRFIVLIGIRHRFGGAP